MESIGKLKISPEKLEKKYPKSAVTLKNLGATTEQFQKIFLAISTDYPDDGQLTNSFNILKELGASLNKHEKLFLAFAEQPFICDSFKDFFLFLKSVLNAELNDLDQEFLLAAYQNYIESGDLISPGIERMDALQIKGEGYWQYYTPDLVQNTLEVETILRGLQNAGYKLNTHAFLYQALLERLTRPGYTMDITRRIFNKVCAFAAEESKLMDSNEKGFQDQHDKLMAIINENAVERFTYGPLEKNESTLDIEALLQGICETDIDCIEMSFNESDGFILRIPGLEEVNLSLLLNNANLSHLALDNDLIRKIGLRLSELTNQFVVNENEAKKYDDTDNLAKELKEAIRIYISNDYKNINRLFRNEPLVDVDSNSELINGPVNTPKNMLIYFLLGCLINEAANKLMVLPSKKNEKEHYTRLTRKLFLTTEAKKRLAANPEKLPAITSYSVFESEDSHDDTGQLSQITLQGKFKYRVINPREGEVIFPQGVQMVYTPGSPDSSRFFASLKRSPSIQRQDLFWSDSALSYAYHEYLSKPYKDSNEEVMLNGVVIYRPNHAMAHTYRVMDCIEIVVDYFALHAENDEFRLFAQSVTNTELEWLRVAAAFSVTGRESESSAKENMPRYNQYKKASAKNLEQFIQAVPPRKSDDEMQERMVEIVRYLGHPDYESNINNHPDLIERNYRNFLYRILTIAHNLDLSRCYYPEKFAESLKLCHDLCKKNPQQEADYQRMIRYAVNLSKAHGNKLTSDINPDGSTIAVSQPYKPIFAEVNSSIKRLKQVSDTVQRPKITEKYQFGHSAPSTGI